MTYKKSDDSDFALNHLDDSAPPPHIHDEPLTFDSMPPLGHNQEPGAEESAFPFGNAWENTPPPPVADFSSRTEPVIKAEPDELYDPYTSHHPDHESTHEPPSEPIHNDMPPPSAATPATGNPQMETLLRYAPGITAAIALVVSLIALASGSHTIPQDNSAVEEAYNNRIQQLERQVADLELQKNHQPADYDEQINQLQEQFATLARGVSELSRRQQDQKTSPPPARPQVNATAPSTSPVHHASHTATSGWAINIVSLDSLAAARKAQQRLQAEGITTEIAETTIRGKTWYRIHTQIFPGRDKADAYKKMLAEKHGIKDAWTQKY